MTEEAKAALEKSIQHWERLASGKRQLNEEPGVVGCALCALFWKSGDYSIRCDGCPVRERTGFDCCRGTPYVDVAKFWDSEDPELLDTDEFRELAKAELEFLKSLLPKGSPQ